MHEPLVTILLATYDGEHYLKEQLDSIIQQTHKNWTILASDDGSRDRTLSILNEYNVVIQKGPSKGFAANFLSLIINANSNSDYYAFADQDDVWEASKLKHALTLLDAVPKNIPALYCGRTYLVDENLSYLGCSPLFKKKPSFKNALAQNIGGGNTMIFNQAALTLLRQTNNHNPIVSHDWWAYLLISGSGGTVYYDPTPRLYYRQHMTNLVGGNSNWLARFYRVRMLFKGRLKNWVTLNNNHLLEISHVLTPENKQILAKFELARQSWFGLRLIKIMKLGIHRQTIFGQLGFLVGLLFNKI